jgi:hypothetical protein
MPRPNPSLKSVLHLAKLLNYNLPYSIIAERFGTTRGSVAGLVHRHIKREGGVATPLQVTSASQDAG